MAKQKQLGEKCSPLFLSSCQEGLDYKGNEKDKAELERFAESFPLVIQSEGEISLQFDEETPGKKKPIIIYTKKGVIACLQTGAKNEDLYNVNHSIKFLSYLEGLIRMTWEDYDISIHILKE